MHRYFQSPNDYSVNDAPTLALYTLMTYPTSNPLSKIRIIHGRKETSISLLSR